MLKRLRNLTSLFVTMGPILVALSCMKQDATAPTAEADLVTSATVVQPKIAFARRVGHHADIFVMNADGTGQRRLTFGGDSTHEFPVWSPDGKQILFTRCYTSNPRLFLMNADGSNQRLLAGGMSCGVEAEIPAWSPDGSRIAYIGFDHAVRIINADRTGDRKLTSNTSGTTEYAPAWSPDGRRIAYAGPWNVHVINADGSRPKQLTNEPRPTDPMPAWSPNSGTIAFVSRRDGNFEIYRMKADGTRQIRLTKARDTCPSPASGLCGDRYPAWSPDGRKIAFTSSRDGNDEIYVMNADGTRQTRLTRNAGSDFKPKWSWDGRKIFFTSTRRGNLDVYAMNADGTRQVNLSRNVRDDFDPDVYP
jgi:Tol biopolymer transport system component